MGLWEMKGHEDTVMSTAITDQTLTCSVDDWIVRGQSQKPYSYKRTHDALKVEGFVYNMLMSTIFLVKLRILGTYLYNGSICWLGICLFFS